MIDIKRKEECCCCHACYNICPNGAISLKEDEYGFKYPTVDLEKCTKCGLCQTVCPMKNDSKLENKIVAYAVINNDSTIRQASSSGGVFSLLAEEILNDNGVVFGAQFNESFNVIHSYVESVDELEKFRGSKYVQSTIGDTYKEVKHFLNSGRKVLFTGTPCQVEGLKSYLMKDYENLYLQDIICHGVPSPKVWDKYKEYRRNMDAESPKKISFRNKKTGWKKFGMMFEYENTKYHKDLDKDLYMKVFLNNICLRDSCYSCKFKKINRESDITLADFWGIEKIKPHLDDDKGISLVIINSEKGAKLFEMISKKTKFEKVELSTALEHNSAMTISAYKHKSRESFFEDVDKVEFDVLVKKYIKKRNILIRILSRVKRLVHKKHH